MSTVPPGAFHNVGLDDDPYKDTRRIETTVKVEISQCLVQCFNVYKGIFGEPENIIYPASGSDISLRQAFPKSHITFIDPSVPCTNAIREQVANAIVHCMKFENYQGGGYDLGFIANAWCPYDQLPNHIKNGGHILAGGPGWNFDAEPYLSHKKTKLIGVFLHGEDGFTFSQEDLQGYSLKIGMRDLRGGKYQKEARYYLFEVLQ